MSLWRDSKRLGLFFAWAAFVLIMAPPVPAHAHKVYLYAWVEGDAIQVDAYFSKSKKVNEGTIRVYDSKGNILLQGVTDAEGGFSFPIPKKDDLRLEVEAGMGHKGEFQLAADELPDVQAAAETEAVSPPAAGSTAAPSASPDKSGADSVDSGQALASIDPELLKSVINSSLDEKLKPIIRQLAGLQEDHGPGAVEIIGGLGWVFGIMGLAMYIRSKKMISDQR